MMIDQVPPVFRHSHGFTVSADQTVEINRPVKTCNYYFPGDIPDAAGVDCNMAARFLLLIYSILEELSLHGLLFRSDCSWLSGAVSGILDLATLSGVQQCTGLCPGVLPSQFHSHPELAASLPSQDLLSRFGGRERC